MIGTITVVNKYHVKPDEHTVYIGRGSVFGNPFTEGTREEMIAEYKTYFHKECLKPRSPLKEGVDTLFDRMMDGENLKLMCFCKPKACHGDVIKDYLQKAAKAILTQELFV